MAAHADPAYLAEAKKLDISVDPLDGEKVVELDTSIGRLSRMDAMQSQQMALELRRRREQQLLRVQNALKRMNRGTYGVCGKCRAPMPEERLEIQPEAVLCVRCSE